MDCIFCKIIDGIIPANKIFEDEWVVAFHDLTPQAPVHFLIIPKVHITSVAELTSKNSSVIAKIFEIIPDIAKQLELQNGYRVVTNIGKDGGQTVSHLHFHVLGKRNLAWPPG